MNADPWQTAAELPARLINGRPARVAARALTAAALAAAAAHFTAGTPAAPAIEAAAALWLAVTSHPELAPPRPERG